MKSRQFSKRQGNQNQKSKRGWLRGASWARSPEKQGADSMRTLRFESLEERRLLSISIDAQALSFLRPQILQWIEDADVAASSNGAAYTKFASNNFQAGASEINTNYQNATTHALNSYAFTAADFGRVLATAQAFYANSNWVHLSYKNPYFSTALVNPYFSTDDSPPWNFTATNNLISVAGGTAVLIQQTDQPPPNTKITVDAEDLDGNAIKDHYFVTVQDTVSNTTRYGIISGYQTLPATPQPWEVLHGYDSTNRAGLAKDASFSDTPRTNPDGTAAIDPTSPFYNDPEKAGYDPTIPPDPNNPGYDPQEPHSLDPEKNPVVLR